MIEAKRMGRPPRRAGERLSKNRTFRVRDKLDEQLRAAAEQSGRTVSGEIEHRLEISLQDGREARNMTEFLFWAVVTILAGIAVFAVAWVARGYNHPI